MNVNGSGRWLLRGSASKSGGSSPVRCCHWTNWGALGSDVSIHARCARRSCSVMARSGRPSATSARAPPRIRNGSQDCLHGVTCFYAKAGAGYGNRTRLTGLGSQDITTMLSPRLRAAPILYARPLAPEHLGLSTGAPTLSPNHPEHLVPSWLPSSLGVVASRFRRKQRFGVGSAHVEMPVGNSAEKPSSV